jgi:hypothetical protein
VFDIVKEMYKFYNLDHSFYTITEVVVAPPAIYMEYTRGKLDKNDICNQCLSPLTLRVRILLMARCTQYNAIRGCRGHNRMVVGFTTTYAISAHHH